MKNTAAVSLTFLVASVGCGGGPPAPPSLEYDVPTPPAARYDVSDTTEVSLSMMGQSMELSQEGVGLFAVSFATAPQGVAVELAVEELAATLRQPMGAPLTIDESYVTGVLSFSLDRRGNATVTAQPDVRAEASQLVSGLTLAHTFFPGLPGRAALPGDRWTDTVRYEGDDAGGRREETSVLDYAVLGDTVVADRSLLVISVDGTSTSTSSMELSGMNISQQSEVQVSGQYLWDAGRGLMYASRRTATGTGTVRVPVMPTPLPIRIESRRTARLRDR